MRRKIFAHLIIEVYFLKRVFNGAASFTAYIDDEVESNLVKSGS